MESKTIEAHLKQQAGPQRLERQEKRLVSFLNNLCNFKIIRFLRNSKDMLQKPKIFI